MELKGSHTIRADTLLSLRDQLNALPDSVLSNAEVTDAYVDTIEERTFHEDYTVKAWYITLSAEWAVQT